MEPAVRPLHATLRMHSDLLLNCLDGLSDDEARRRISGRTNSVAFLAAHVTDARHFIAGYLGCHVENPLALWLDDVRSIDEMQRFPTLELIRSAWCTASVRLDDHLPQLTAEQISARSPQRFPLGGDTLLDGLAFLLHHESYHIGQMALLRKELGYPAMTYTRSWRDQDAG